MGNSPIRGDVSGKNLALTAEENGVGVPPGQTENPSTDSTAIAIPEVSSQLITSVADKNHPLFKAEGKDLDLQKLLAGMDAKEQRGLLITALELFAKHKDEAKVQEVLNLLTLSMPMFETSNVESLQVHTLMYLSLKGSGLPQEKFVKEMGEGLADGLVNPEATLADQIKQAILAREFFQIAGGGEELAKLSKFLRRAQDQIAGELTQNWELKPKERVRLAGLAVKIDSLLLQERIAEVNHPDYEGLTLGEQILPRLKAYREELAQASGLNFEQRLKEGIQLARLAAPLSNLFYREPALVDESQVKAELRAIQQMMLPLIQESFTQDPEAPAAQKELAKKLSIDLQTRFQTALEAGDTQWLGQLDVEGIQKFGRIAQSAHVLLDQAKKSTDTVPLEKIRQAAALFASVGLKDRVVEALAPVHAIAEGMEPLEARAALLLQLSQSYQLAKMIPEANQTLGQIILLGKQNAGEPLNLLSRQAHFYQLLNQGKLGAARDVLKSLPSTPENLEQIKKLDAGVQNHRLLGGLHVLGAVLSDHFQNAYPEDPAMQSALENSIQGVMAETYRLVSSGEIKSFERAFKQVMDQSSFSSQFSGFANETHEAQLLWDYLAQVTHPSVDDGQLPQAALALANRLSVKNYFLATGVLGDFVAEHPHAGTELQASAHSLKEDIPSIALMSTAFFVVQELISMFSVAGNMLNPNIKMDAGYFTRAGLTIGTLGIARSVGVGVQALWVSRMESVIASPVAFRLSTVATRSVSEAAAFPLAHMSFQSLMTGNHQHWNWKHFGVEFGSMMVMFSMLNAGSMSLQWGGAKTQGAVKRAQEALAKAKEAGTGVAQAEKVLARSKLADNLVRSKATAWGVRVNSFTGSSYANEGLKLKEEEKGARFLARFLNSAVIDAQMIMGGKIVDAASGGRIGKLEKATHQGLQRHFMKHQMGKAGMFDGPFGEFLKELVEQNRVAVTPDGQLVMMKGDQGTGPKGPRGTGSSGSVKSVAAGKTLNPESPARENLLDLLKEFDIPGEGVHKSFETGVRFEFPGGELISVPTEKLAELFLENLPPDKHVTVGELRKVIAYFGESFQGYEPYVRRGIIRHVLNQQLGLGNVDRFKQEFESGELVLRPTVDGLGFTELYPRGPVIRVPGAFSKTDLRPDPVQSSEAIQKVTPSEVKTTGGKNQEGLAFLRNVFGEEFIEHAREKPSLQRFLNFLNAEELGQELYEGLASLVSVDKPGDTPRQVRRIRQYIHEKATDEWKQTLLYSLASELVQMGRLAEVDSILREENFPVEVVKTRDGEVTHCDADMIRMELMEELLTREMFIGDNSVYDHLGQFKTTQSRYQAWSKVLSNLVMAGATKEAMDLIETFAAESHPQRLSEVDYNNIRDTFREVLKEYNRYPTDEAENQLLADMAGDLKIIATQEGVRLEIFGEVGQVFFMPEADFLIEKNRLPEGFEPLAVETWRTPDGQVVLKPKMPEDLIKAGIQPGQWTEKSHTLSLESAAKLGLIEGDGLGSFFLVSPPPLLLKYRPGGNGGSEPPADPNAGGPGGGGFLPGMWGNPSNSSPFKASGYWGSVGRGEFKPGHPDAPAVDSVLQDGLMWMSSGPGRGGKPRGKSKPAGLRMSDEVRGPGDEAGPDSGSRVKLLEFYRELLLGSTGSRDATLENVLRYFDMVRQAGRPQEVFETARILRERALQPLSAEQTRGDLVKYELLALFLDPTQKEHFIELTALGNDLARGFTNVETGRTLISLLEKMVGAKLDTGSYEIASRSNSLGSMIHLVGNKRAPLEVRIRAAGAMERFFGNLEVHDRVLIPAMEVLRKAAQGKLGELDPESTIEAIGTYEKLAQKLEDGHHELEWAFPFLQGLLKHPQAEVAREAKFALDAFAEKYPFSYDLFTRSGPRLFADEIVPPSGVYESDKQTPHDLVLLKNGSTEYRGDVKGSLFALEKLFNDDQHPMAFLELVMKARNPEHKFFGNAEETLRERGFLDKNGQVHSTHRNVVLSATEAKEADLMDLVFTKDPIAETEKPVSEAKAEVDLEKLIEASYSKPGKWRDVLFLARSENHDGAYAHLGNLAKNSESVLSELENLALEGMEGFTKNAGNTAAKKQRQFFLSIRELIRASEVNPQAEQALDRVAQNFAGNAAGLELLNTMVNGVDAGEVAGLLPAHETNPRSSEPESGKLPKILGPLSGLATFLTGKAAMAQEQVGNDYTVDLNVPIITMVTLTALFLYARARYKNRAAETAEVSVSPEDFAEIKVPPAYTEPPQVYFQPSQGDGRSTGIIMGDITRVPAEAYVVPHFQDRPGNDFGVAQAMDFAGAKHGMMEYWQHVKLPQTDGHRQNWGETKVTGSGGGNSDFLVHVVSLHPKASPMEQMDLIRRATFQSLVAASDHGIESIAIPIMGMEDAGRPLAGQSTESVKAIAAGLQGQNIDVVAGPITTDGKIGVLTPAESAMAMLDAVEAFRERHPDSRLKEIGIVVPGSQFEYDTFVSVLKEGTAADFEHWTSWLVNGFNVQEAAKSSATQRGPYHELREKRRAQLKGEPYEITEVAMQRAVTMEKFYGTARGSLNRGGPIDRFMGKLFDRVETNEYRRIKLRAQEILRFELPADVVIQDVMVVEYLPQALEAVRQIPISEAKQNQLLIDIFFERCIPHNDSFIRPLGGVVFDHVKILRAIGQVHREVQLSPEVKEEVLNKILGQTQPSRIGDDQFLLNVLFPTMKAMENNNWSVEQMLMMLHLVRGNSQMGESEIPQVLENMTREGINFDEQFSLIKKHYHFSYPKNSDG